MSEYTVETEKHIESLNLEDRKKLGQYMTPASLGDKMVDLLDIPKGASPKVLDPACGTGELLLAVERICPQAQLAGFDVDKGMIGAASRNLPNAKLKCLSIFDISSRSEYGKYDYIIGNPPYFEMKKDADELLLGGVEGFASLEDKGRLNIYALFVEYALRLLHIGGKMSFLIPPSMNNGAFFKKLRVRAIELGRIDEIYMVRENDSFSDALTSVQILLMTRTAEGYEKNLEASSKYIYETSGNVIFTDKKETIEAFSSGKQKIKDLGFITETGTVVWNQHKKTFQTGTPCPKENNAALPSADGIFEKPPADNYLPVLFSKDIASDNTIRLSSKISAPGHWLPRGEARACEGKGIIVNRIVGSLDNPRLRFALVDLDEFYGENHVNVIRREDGDDEAVVKLYSALNDIASDDLSEYLKAVTGNTQLSATELGELPVSW